jgi:hypothetical protein
MAVRRAECFHIKLRHSDQVRRAPAVSANVPVNHLEIVRILRRDVKNRCKVAKGTSASLSQDQSAHGDESSELYTPAQASTIRESWDILMRWSRVRTRRSYRRRHGILQETTKVSLPFCFLSLFPDVQQPTVAPELVSSLCHICTYVRRQGTS